MLDIPKRLFEALEQKPITNRVRNNQQMYPSSASIRLKNGDIQGACARQTYYRWFAASRDGQMDPETQLVCDYGNALHDMLTDLMSRTSRLSNLDILSVEQGFYNPSIFGAGRTDGVLYDNNTNLIHGLEIKTVGDYKSTVTIDSPAVEHILQSAQYLHEYNENAKKCGTQEIQDWIILYLARSENYKLKKYPHRSPFKYLWQFTVEIDKTDQHVIVTTQAGNVIHYREITISGIYDRFKENLKSIKEKKIPSREFEYQYSEEKLTAMSKLTYAQGGLSKPDTAKVDKWIAAGAPEGELGLSKGDFSCRYCDYSKTCYSNAPDVFDVENTALINIKKPETTEEDTDSQQTHDIF